MSKFNHLLLLISLGLLGLCQGGGVISRQCTVSGTGFLSNHMPYNLIDETYNPYWSNEWSHPYLDPREDETEVADFIVYHAAIRSLNEFDGHECIHCIECNRDEGDIYFVDSIFRQLNNTDCYTYLSQKVGVHSNQGIVCESNGNAISAEFTFINDTCYDERASTSSGRDCRDCVCDQNEDISLNKFKSKTISISKTTHFYVESAIKESQYHIDYESMYHGNKGLLTPNHETPLIYDSMAWDSDSYQIPYDLDEVHKYNILVSERYQCLRMLTIYISILLIAVYLSSSIRCCIVLCLSFVVMTESQHFNCMEDRQCSGETMVCHSNESDCIVNCYGEGSCKYSIINGTGAGNLIINGSGAGYALEDSDIICPANKYCNISCNGMACLRGSTIDGDIGTNLFINAFGDEVMSHSDIYCPPDNTKTVCNIHVTGIAALDDAEIYAMESFENVALNCDGSNICYHENSNPYLYCTEDINQYCKLKKAENETGFVFADVECICNGYQPRTLLAINNSKTTSLAPTFTPIDDPADDPADDTRYILYVSSSNGSDTGTCDSPPIYIDTTPLYPPSSECNQKNTLIINESNTFVHSISDNIYCGDNCEGIAALCFDISSPYICYHPTVRDIEYETIDYSLDVNQYLNIGYQNRSNLINSNPCSGGEELNCNVFRKCPADTQQLDAIWSANNGPYTFYAINGPLVGENETCNGNTVNVRLSLSCSPLPSTCKTLDYALLCLQGNGVCNQYDGNGRIELFEGNYSLNRSILHKNKQLEINGMGYTKTRLNENGEANPLILCNSRQCYITISNLSYHTTFDSGINVIKCINGGNIKFEGITFINSNDNVTLKFIFDTKCSVEFKQCIFDKQMVKWFITNEAIVRFRECQFINIKGSNYDVINSIFMVKNANLELLDCHLEGNNNLYAIINAMDHSKVTVKDTILIENDNNTYIWHSSQSSGSLINSPVNISNNCGSNRCIYFVESDLMIDTISASNETVTFIHDKNAPTLAPSLVPTLQPTSTPSFAPTIYGYWSEWPVGTVHGHNTYELSTEAGYHISNVCVRSGAFIDSIQVNFTNGDSSGPKGGDGGLRDHCYSISDPSTECFISVNVRISFWLIAIQFITSTGQSSQWLGNTDKNGGSLHNITGNNPNDCITKLTVKQNFWNEFPVLTSIRVYFEETFTHSPTEMTLHPTNAPSIAPTQLTFAPSFAPTVYGYWSDWYDGTVHPINTYELSTVYGYHISNVCVRSGGRIDSIQVNFTNGDSSGPKGGDGGLRDHCYSISDPSTECFISVNVRISDGMVAIQFITATGQSSQWLGNTDNNDGLVHNITGNNANDCITKLTVKEGDWKDFTVLTSIRVYFDEIFTLSPTIYPSNAPTIVPSEVTFSPSFPPTLEPTIYPTNAPTVPTSNPTQYPTLQPTFSTPSPTLPPPVGILECGDVSKNGSITAADIKYYSFSLSMSYDTILIDACQSNYDTYLYFLDSSGNELARNDDNNHCDQYQSALFMSNVNAGYYLIGIGGYEGAYGSYQLDILCSTNVPTSTPTLQPSIIPTISPSIIPSTSPTTLPTIIPSTAPTPYKFVNMTLFTLDFEPETVSQRINMVNFPIMNSHDRIVFSPCNPFDSQNSINTQFDISASQTSTAHVYNESGSFYKNTWHCNEAICFIKCEEEILTCFGSHFITNNTQTSLIQCSSSSSCENNIVDISAAYTGSIICDASASCQEMVVHVTNSNKFTIDCIQTGSCTKIAINVTNTTEAIIICHGTNSCDGLNVWSTSNDIKILIQSYNKDISIFVPSEYKKENLKCND